MISASSQFFSHNDATLVYAKLTQNSRISYEGVFNSSIRQLEMSGKPLVLRLFALLKALPNESQKSFALHEQVVNYIACRLVVV